jgi:hypothetical protein
MRAWRRFRRKVRAKFFLNNVRWVQQVGEWWCWAVRAGRGQPKRASGERTPYPFPFHYIFGGKTIWQCIARQQRSAMIRWRILVVVNSELVTWVSCGLKMRPWNNDIERTRFSCGLFWEECSFEAQRCFALLRT